MLYIGTLPWRNPDKNNKLCEIDILLRKKQDCIIHSSLYSKFISLPSCFAKISDYLKSLKFKDIPEYKKIENMLYEILTHKRSKFLPTMSNKTLDYGNKNTFHRI